jgi:hypothetical protein
VTIKDQEATTERCSFTKRFSTNHDLSFTKSTENSNTRISLGASSTDGIENTGLDKYNATVYNANDFFGGALEERIIYASKDRTTLLSNDAGFIGNIIGTACTGIQHRQFIQRELQYSK